MYYYSANDYFKEKFNEKVYKISLDGGMSCPNRDANKLGGCIFCSNGGSGDFAIKYNGNIKCQINDAIKMVEKKNAKKFIAYFQSYTNTYASIEYLKKIYYEAIERDDVVALSIATRPDSISKECYGLLSEINKIKPVFVELGLQTSNDNTAKLINRGYETNIYKECVIALKNIGVNVITHLIIGLPNENENDLLNSIKYINNLTDGVKFTLLHVLKNTKLEDMYNKKVYNTLTKEEYIRLLSLAINHLNPNIVIHRITGDGPKSILVAPLYSADKKGMLASINKYFKENNVYQGKNYVL